MNDIGYADGLVLLGPSVGALRKLIKILCESNAGTYELKFNVLKREVIVFKAGVKCYSEVPPIMLHASSLNRVRKFKHLDHGVSEAVSGNLDTKRECRSLAVQCDTLTHRYARFTIPVKVRLFKTFCQPFNTCSLWVNFKTYLRVQYNSAF